jgi:hypothetical protein
VDARHKAGHDELSWKLNSMGCILSRTTRPRWTIVLRPVLQSQGLMWRTDFAVLMVLLKAALV